MTPTAASEQQTTNGSGQDAGEHEPSDQERFDAVVDRDSRIVLSILAAAGIFAALVMSAVALLQSSNTTTRVTTVTRTVTAAAPAAASGAASPTITVSVAPGSKRGPDGKMHDAFSNTEYNVKAGQVTYLRIDNKDEGTHSITSPVAGVNIVVQPGLHTYKLLVTRPGRFEWKCIVPCDDETHGWAMTHPGYMAGYITAS